jgi:hypothetical protein
MIPNAKTGTLDFYRIPDSSHPPLPPTTAACMHNPTPLLRLALPQLKCGNKYYTIMCRCDPNPLGCASVSRSREPFHVKAETAIILCNVRIVIPYRNRKNVGSIKEVSLVLRRDLVVDVLVQRAKWVQKAKKERRERRERKEENERKESERRESEISLVVEREDNDDDGDDGECVDDDEDEDGDFGILDDGDQSWIKEANSLAYGAAASSSILSPPSSAVPTTSSTSMDVDSDSSDSHSTTSTQTSQHIFGPPPTSSHLPSTTISTTISPSSKPTTLPVRIPYHLWGPSTARFFPDPRIRTTSGMRFSMLRQAPPEDQQYFIVYDFNPFNVRQLVEGPETGPEMGTEMGTGPEMGTGVGTGQGKGKGKGKDTEREGEYEDLDLMGQKWRVGSWRQVRSVSWVAGSSSLSSGSSSSTGAETLTGAGTSTTTATATANGPVNTNGSAVTQAQTHAPPQPPSPSTPEAQTGAGAGAGADPAETGEGTIESEVPVCAFRCRDPLRAIARGVMIDESRVIVLRVGLSPVFELVGF